MTGLAVAAGLTMLGSIFGSPPPPASKGSAGQTSTSTKSKESTNASNSLPSASAAAVATSEKYPVIHRAEVEKHKDKDSGIWVTYGEGVYDVTQFVTAHPGGDKILLAAGGAVEKYWAMYAQHKQQQVYDMLDEMRIGTLPVEERITATEDPYDGDPARHESIRIQSSTPFNGEAPTDVLLQPITPNELHFKRNHMPVPDVVPEAFELQIIGSSGDVETTLTLSDLQTKFAKHTVTTTLQCAGNRRSEMAAVRDLHGLPWGNSAISTARWSGARLSDVLAAAAVKPGPDAVHVQFVGLDADMKGERYGASIPIQKALSPDGDCILAYEMNGESIPRDHGFPLRAVVPGHVAARSVKWVEKVIVSDEESDSHWQQHDYKGFCPDEDWKNLDWSKAPAIQEMPVTSAILSPAPGSPLPADSSTLKVKGYAFAGGGREVVRVDMSVDGGSTWQAAKLLPPVGDTGFRKHWAWRHWEIEVPVKGLDNVELVCKAVDDSYNVQPDTFGPIYNARGVLSNAWHHVSLGQQTKKSPEEGS